MAIATLLRTDKYLKAWLVSICTLTKLAMAIDVVALLKRGMNRNEVSIHSMTFSCPKSAVLVLFDIW